MLIMAFNFWHPIQSVKDTLKYGIISFFLLLDSLVYMVCSLLYSLFVGLSRVQILTEDAYSAIANRIYILVGIVALFIMTFTLLQSMVDPDKVGQNVIKSFKSLVTSILLVILLPTIFKYAFSFQNAIISDGVIHNILDIDLGKADGNSNLVTMDNACIMDDAEEKELIKEISSLPGIFNSYADEIRAAFDDLKKSSGNNDAVNEIYKARCRGNYIVMTLLSAFIQPTDSSSSDKWNIAVKYVSVTGNFSYVRKFADNISDKTEYVYIFLISTAAGLFFAYVILSFCIDLGIRTFKLAFYEMIAPIPIFLRMLPGKDSYFNKWVSATTKCFLEVFVRVLLMEFMIFMCRNFLTLIDMAFDGLSQVALLGKAVLILGLCGFIKQAPKLFSEALGIEGTGVKLNVKEKIQDNAPLREAAALGAGATAGVRNLFSNIHDISKADTPGGKVKALLRTPGSVFAGAASGMNRAWHGAKDAKTFDDMKKAAGDAAKAATDKRYERKNYRATHGDSLLGVAAGHIKDTGTGIAQWAGINSLDYLMDSQKKIREVEDARKAMFEKAKTEALKDSDRILQNNYGLDVGGYNNMSILKNDYDLLKASAAKLDPNDKAGRQKIAKELQQMEKYMTNMERALANDYMNGYVVDNGNTVENWNKISGEYKALAQDFKTKAKFNYTAIKDVLPDTPENNTSLAALKAGIDDNSSLEDFIRSGAFSMYDNSKNAVVNSSGAIAQQVNAQRQKQQESKK